MRLLRLGLVGACGLVLVWSAAWAWQTTITGTLSSFELAQAVAVDGSDDVVAAGWTYSTDSGRDFTVVKLDGAGGAERWRYVLTGTLEGGLEPHSFDEARAVVVDRAGDVVAAGWTEHFGSGRDFTVVKLDGATGAERWVQRITGTANTEDVAWAVAVDGAGDVVAAGLTINTGSGRDFTVLKLDSATGAVRWGHLITGTASGFDEARAVVVDGAGDVVAAGQTHNTSSGEDFTVVKFDGATGAVRWGHLITGTANRDDEAQAVVVDGAGDVVAAGQTHNTGSGEDFTVVKFDGATGAVRWIHLLNGTLLNSRDLARDVVVDGADDIVAAGWTENTDAGINFTVVKLDGATGAERWDYLLNGTLNGFAHAEAVVVDEAGDVVAAGATENTGSDRDLTVVKLDGATGAERWDYLLNGTLNDVDVALAVAVEGAGDVVAAGGTHNTGSGLDFTVVKLRGSDGGDVKVPFAAFTVTVEIKGEAFEVKGPFTLGEASDGIEPFKEEVSFRIGPFALTIPANSFAQDKKGGFKFEGTIDGIALEVTIAPQGDDTFEFKAEGTGADLSGLENPVPVTLTIGDDHGTTTVVAEI